MYSMVPIVTIFNNIVKHIWKLLKEQILKFLSQEKQIV